MQKTFKFCIDTWKGLALTDIEFVISHVLYIIYAVKLFRTVIHKFHQVYDHKEITMKNQSEKLCLLKSISKLSLIIVSLAI